MSSDREHLFQQVTSLALTEAASQLSASCKAGIHVRLEGCRHDHWDTLLAELPDDGNLLCVSQNLRPATRGIMLWLSEERSARELLLHLLGEDLQLDVLTEMEEEALIEIGNRLINRCLEHHAQLAPSIQGALSPRLWRQSAEEMRSRLPTPETVDQATWADLVIEFDSRSLSSSMIWCGEPWSTPGAMPVEGRA